MNEFSLISPQQLAKTFITCPAITEHLDTYDLTLCHLFQENTQHLFCVYPSTRPTINSTFLTLQHTESDKLKSGPFTDYLLRDYRMLTPKAIREEEQPAHLYLLTLFVVTCSAPFFDLLNQRGPLDSRSADSTSFFSLSEQEEHYIVSKTQIAKNAALLSEKCENYWGVKMDQEIKNKLSSFDSAYFLVQEISSHNIQIIRDEWDAFRRDDYCLKNPDDVYSCQVDEIFSEAPEVVIALWLIAFESRTLLYPKINTFKLEQTLIDVLRSQKPPLFLKAIEWIQKHENHPAISKLVEKKSKNLFFNSNHAQSG